MEQKILTISVHRTRKGQCLYDLFEYSNNMDYTIHDLPEHDRPREKLTEHGAGQLTDTELLAILLRTGTQGKNVLELSAEILTTYRLHELGNRSLTELQEFDGVSQVKAGQLQAIGELATRLQNEECDTISGLDDVKTQVQDMTFLADEVLRVFHLSNGNELLQTQEINGSVDAVDFRLRDMFRDAVRENAAAVILAHNHPSGEAAATQQDISVTEEAIELGEKLGVTVLDHVIVGNEVTSLRQDEPSLF
jgi:DNA repair protein RadC